MRGDGCGPVLFFCVAVMGNVLVVNVCVARNRRSVP